MNIISLQQVDKSYGSRLLFKEATMTITAEQRIGLIGVNGTGKSTFLKLLAGLLPPDKGEIIVNGKAAFSYVQQQPEFSEEESVLSNIFLSQHPLLALVKKYEELSAAKVQDERYLRILEEMDAKQAWQVEQDAKIILKKLGFEDIYQPVKFLSGGQRRRLALGQALLYPCDLLLLDEPTNHLDEDAIEWLEKFLVHRKGGLIVSTHDRYFLNAVCTEILELSQRRFYHYEGNYEYFLEKKAQREAMQLASEEKREQFLKKELVWVRRGALARTTKQKARLQRYEALANMEKMTKTETLDPIRLQTRLGKTVFDIEDVSFSYEDKNIVENFTYHMVRHDRIGIVGNNGIGKSTFMKLLEGKLEPKKGSIKRGETVRIAHFTQEMPLFDPDMRVLDYIREERRYLLLSDGSSISAGQLLERFLFTPDLHGVPIKKLSGGEKRRLFLLKLLMSAPNVLLLDEPTNDLDIPTLEVLEDFLDNFMGVIITVCHDRYFLDRVVDKLFVFEGQGKIRIVHDSYSDFKEAQDSEEKISEDKTKKAQHAPQFKSEEKAKGLTITEKKEYESILAELPRLELLHKGLGLSLEQIGSDYELMADIITEREKVQNEIERLTERWLELEEKM